MNHISIESFVNTDRYPIDQLESPKGEALVSRSLADLEKDGALVLKGFLKPIAVDKILGEAEEIFSTSYCRPHQANVYLTANDPSYSNDHARNRTLDTSYNVVANDKIPQNSVLRSLYTWDTLNEFLSTLLKSPKLYCYDDPLGSVNVNFTGPGQELGWHFDNTDFAITLMLQNPDAGGTFEYLPAARSKDDEGYDAVDRVLDGNRTGIRTITQEPGDLVLFRGRYALHRVTKVGGSLRRIIAVLVYDKIPGVQLTEFNRNLLYGRIK